MNHLQKNTFIPGVLYEGLVHFPTVVQMISRDWPDDNDSNDGNISDYYYYRC